MIVNRKLRESPSWTGVEKTIPASNAGFTLIQKGCTFGWVHPSSYSLSYTKKLLIGSGVRLLLPARLQGPGLSPVPVLHIPVRGSD